MRIWHAMDSGSEGFTLLETLTALTILSIAMVSLFRAQSTGLQAVGRTEFYAQARILAQSLLARSLGAAGERPQERDGRDGPFNWSVAVFAAKQPWAALSRETHWQLHRVRVTVSWGRGRSVELETLKLAGRRDRSSR